MGFLRIFCWPPRSQPGYLVYNSFSIGWFLDEPYMLIFKRVSTSTSPSTETSFASMDFSNQTKEDQAALSFPVTSAVALSLEIWMWWWTSNERKFSVDGEKSWRNPTDIGKQGNKLKILQVTGWPNFLPSTNFGICYEMTHNCNHQQGNGLKWWARIQETGGYLRDL